MCNGNEMLLPTRGIVSIQLEAASFQALLFYRHLGFEVFGKLPNMPIGQTW